MIKNEGYVEISTHTGSLTFIHHFTTGECSVFSNVARRVELYREHLEFVPVSYNALGFIEEIRLN